MHVAGPGLDRQPALSVSQGSRDVIVLDPAHRQGQPSQVDVTAAGVEIDFRAGRRRHLERDVARARLDPH